MVAQTPAGGDTPPNLQITLSPTHPTHPPAIPASVPAPDASAPIWRELFEWSMQYVTVAVETS